MIVKDSAVSRLWGRECIPTALIGSIRLPENSVLPCQGHTSCIQYSIHLLLEIPWLLG